MNKWIKDCLSLMPPIKRHLDMLDGLRKEMERQQQSAARLNAELLILYGLFYHLLPHDVSCAYAFTTGSEIRTNTALTNRLVAVAMARIDKNNTGQYVWDIITKNHIEYIKELDQAGFAHIAISPLTDGLLQGQVITKMLREHELLRIRWCNTALDALLSLCEAMELIEIENIELNVRHNITKQTPDDIIESISNFVGFTVTAPDVFSELFGLKTRYGIFTFRHFIALYVAWKLSEKFPDKAGIRIAEIGAGAGLTAYYARQFGFQDYSIFDLPTVNVVQGWFLGQSLPHEELILADDDAPFDKSGFRVLPSEYLEQAPDAFWDVVVNIDSMPEIAPDVVADYLKTLSTKTRLIYSYNHEARPPLDGAVYCGHETEAQVCSARLILRQEPMSWHMARNGNYKRLSRNRAWLRPGYVEEWYAVTQR